MSSSPVLFLIFNRLSTAQLVFEQIRLAKPEKLFIAADGPRNGNKDDEIKCTKVREFVLASVDWPCKVHTLFRKNNLGCGRAVSEAITWFFDHVEQGIILEDDCLPNQDFFIFCDELLKKYATDTSIMSISGSNLLGKSTRKNNESYFFAHGGIWGWASWKRAWALYDFDMSTWTQEDSIAKVKKNIGGDRWLNFYFPLFNDSYKKVLDTWDSQWFYTILINDKLTINPCVNLIENIGFNIEGTHTHQVEASINSLKRYSLDFPLIHPKEKVLDIRYLNKMYNHLHAKKSIMLFFKKAFNRIKRLKFLK